MIASVLDERKDHWLDLVAIHGIKVTHRTAIYQADSMLKFALERNDHIGVNFITQVAKKYARKISQVNLT